MAMEYFFSETMPNEFDVFFERMNVNVKKNSHIFYK